MNLFFYWFFFFSAYRNWMNSLGVNPFVNNIYEDGRDGMLLLQVHVLV